MGRTPKQTSSKPIPKVGEKILRMPPETDIVPEVPAETKDIPETPVETTEIPDMPDETKEVPETPMAKVLDKPMPSDLTEENCVIIEGKKIEIKPTKLKYFRNKTASVYNILKAVPLTDFLNYDKGVFDPNRDADQILFDFLIAVFDDAEFVKDNYDNMTAGTVESILKIFGRLNGIDEKEEAARKNREAQAKH